MVIGCSLLAHHPSPQTEALGQALAHSKKGLSSGMESVATVLRYLVRICDQEPGLVT